MALGGNTAYAGIADLPELVAAAVHMAERCGFDNSCAPDQGRLLSVLARGWSGGRIGETGTGCGVGLAWMINATGPDTSFVSVELDEQRAARAAEFYADRPDVRVVQGDWSGLREHGPFDLLVLDGGGKGKDPALDSRSSQPSAGLRSAEPWFSTTSFRPVNPERSITTLPANTGSTIRACTQRKFGSARHWPPSLASVFADLITVQMPALSGLLSTCRRLM